MHASKAVKRKVTDGTAKLKEKVTKEAARLGRKMGIGQKSSHNKTGTATDKAPNSKGGGKATTTKAKGELHNINKSSDSALTNALLSKTDGKSTNSAPSNSAEKFENIDDPKQPSDAEQNTNPASDETAKAGTDTDNITELVDKMSELESDFLKTADSGSNEPKQSQGPPTMSGSGATTTSKLTTSTNKSTPGAKSTVLVAKNKRKTAAKQKTELGCGVGNVRSFSQYVQYVFLRGDDPDRYHVTRVKIRNLLRFSSRKPYAYKPWQLGRVEVPRGAPTSHAKMCLSGDGSIAVFISRIQVVRMAAQPPPGDDEEDENGNGDSGCSAGHKEGQGDEKVAIPNTSAEPNPNPNLRSRGGGSKENTDDTTLEDLDGTNDATVKQSDTVGQEHEAAVAAAMSALEQAKQRVEESSQVSVIYYMSSIYTRTLIASL